MKSLKDINEGLFSKKKKSSKKDVYTELSDTHDRQIDKLSKEEFKLDKKLLPLLEEKLALIWEQRDIFSKSTIETGPNNDFDRYIELFNEEMERLEKLIYNIKNGLW